jgi:asparagine synthase (glutamine-hydrolysing)
MCGICGVNDFSGQFNINKEKLIAMRDTMVHRGPDECGIFQEHGVALGHRRLKVIDLVTGQQPMCDSSERVWITYNGEVYNYQELRSGLKKKGFHFKTSSDTEVILNLYIDKGSDFVSSMNGMFAFAIWDSRIQKLILTRDRMGVKPLYYAICGQRVVFASEIKAILEYDQDMARFDPAVLGEYLQFRFVSGSNTLFPDVKEVLPGQMIFFTRDKIEKFFYWDIPMNPDNGNNGQTAWADEVEDLLADSIRLRLISDVPVGTFCSGGVDSSLITAMATKARAEPLDTFSVGFEEKEFDERYYARMVSQYVQSKHHEIVVSAAEYAQLLPKMIWHMDEPLNHANSLQIYLISKLAKSLVTVVLTGEGADELFAGYPRYNIVYMINMLRWFPAGLRRTAGTFLKKWKNHKAVKVASVIDQDIQNAILQNAAFIQRNEVLSILDKHLSLTLEDRFDYISSSDDLISRLLYYECKTYLEALLIRQDKMSMAASVESRVPFLDYRLVETAFKIPADYRFPFRNNKAVIKDIGLRHLPREVITRPKRGFGVPLSKWLRDDNSLGQYLDLITDSTCANRGLFKMQNIRKLVDKHRDGTADHGDILWELINFELWHRIFIDRKIQI